MATRATKISLRSDVVAKGGSLTLAIVSDWISASFRESISGDLGAASLVLPADSLNVQSAAFGNVIRFADVYPDAGVDVTREYRITGLEDGPDRNTVVVTAAPIAHDLGKVLVSQLVGGVPLLNLSVAYQTPAQIVSQLLLPALAAAGYSWIVAGTITGDAINLLSWQQLTVMGVLQLLVKQTGFELAITRDTADANYTINLAAHTPVTDDTMPVAWVGRNVVALDRKIVGDQRFFTQVTPLGVTPDGEVETPGIEQAAFKVTAVAGDTLTITNPVSSYGPIGFDDQLNGLTALTTIAPAPLHNGVNTTTGMAYDTSRKTVHVCSALPSAGGQRVYWHKLDDGTSGNYAVSLDMRGIAYAPSSDRLYIADHGGGTCKVVNPATLAVVATITISGGTNPNKVRYLAGWDRIVLQHDSGFDVINPNTNTNLGTIGSSIAREFVVYNAGNNKVWVGSSTQPQAVAYVASTLAASTGFTAPASTSITTIGTDGTTLYCLGDVSGSKVGFTVNPGTNAVSANTVIAALGSVAFAPMAAAELWYSSTSGRLYAISSTYLYELTTAFVRTANLPINFIDTTTQGWWLESSIDYLFLPDGDAHHVKILQTPHLGAYQKATVGSAAGSSRASNQQFDRVAGSRGLTFTGQRVEFRQNTSLDYRKVLTAPAAIATYAPIDGVLPNDDNAGRRNYLRAGSADEWRSDNVEKYLATIDDSNLGIETRWRSSDETALSGSAFQVSSAYTASQTSIVVKGLAAGRVLSPGDVISCDAVTPFGVNNYGVVKTRTVADGSGNATVPLWNGGINQSLAVNAALYLWSPSITSLGPLSTSDLTVLYPSTRGGFLTAAHGMAAVPYIGGISTAWAVARLLVRSLNGAPNTIALAAYGDGSGFSTHEVSIADATAYNDGLCREYVVAQRVDLAPGSTHVALRLRSSLTAPGVVVYVKSLMVIHGAAALIDRDIPFSGSSALWALGNRALQDGISPSVTYQVQAIEDDPRSANGILTLGKEIRLRDPARGIAATPRIVEITRAAVNREQQFRQPVLTLATRPASLVDSVVNLETS